jgi:hypothetical protein
VENYYPGPQLVHVNLMGDPTLRMHPVKSPSDLELFTTQNTVELNWKAPENEELTGYHIYRKDSISEEYIRLTDEVVTDTFYSDFMPPDGGYTYMVRAIKLEKSGSGTYWNRSHGISGDISFRFISSNSEKNKNVIKAFPNPASDFIYLKTEMDLTGVELELVDGKGRVVKKWKPSNGGLNVSGMAPQVYFLKYKGKEKIITQIVIE